MFGKTFYVIHLYLCIKLVKLIPAVKLEEGKLGICLDLALIPLIGLKE